MNIVQRAWPWPHSLTARDSTNYLVVHHTAGSLEQTIDDIWAEHIAIQDNGIAYHRIIMPDGTTYQGRPDWAVGAQAWGLNDDSVGVVLVGYFHPGRKDEAGNDIPPDHPTDAQIAALKDNLIDLRAKYGKVQIIGHRQVAGIINNPEAATDCPGDVLFAMLPAVVAAAEAA